jgi:PTS system nitrogen regulatory IIA component
MNRRLILRLLAALAVAPASYVMAAALPGQPAPAFELADADGRPVRLLVFLLVPEQATQQHLDILSELAQMLSDKPFRESLLTVTEPAAVHALLAKWEPVRPAA